MATQTVKYFSGTQELVSTHWLGNAAFHRRFGFVLLGMRVDGYGKLVGYAPGATMDGQELPVTRVIEYMRSPSKHKCDARCTHAKGRQCECSCGGQFHGSQA